jgi:hypothetical protein
MTPSQEAIAAGVAAARAAITEYSSFDSSMVPDDALADVVVKALSAALDVYFPQASATTKGTTP